MCVGGWALNAQGLFKGINQGQQMNDIFKEAIDGNGSELRSHLGKILRYNCSSLKK
jgi:hypothetical protein